MSATRGKGGLFLPGNQEWVKARATAGRRPIPEHLRGIQLMGSEERGLRIMRLLNYKPSEFLAIFENNETLDANLHDASDLALAMIIKESINRSNPNLLEYLFSQIGLRSKDSGDAGEKPLGAYEELVELFRSKPTTELIAMMRERKTA